MDTQNLGQQFNRIEVIQTVKTPLGFFVLVVLVVEVLLGGIAISSGDVASQTVVFCMVGIIVILIIVVSGMAIWRPESLRGKSTPKSSNIAAAVVYPPNEKERYEKLFKGFDADRGYIAYNPPFEVEFTAPHVLQKAVEINAERYNSRTESMYLFFTEQSFLRAQKFFTKVSLEVDKDLDQIVEKIFWKDTKELPGFTFFLGYKKGLPVIILYPRAVMEEGIPKAVIYIVGAEDLHSILSTFFAKQWNEAKQSVKNILPTNNILE